MGKGAVALAGNEGLQPKPGGTAPRGSLDLRTGEPRTRLPRTFRLFGNLKLEGPGIHGSSPLRKNSYRDRLPASEAFFTFSYDPMSFRKS